MLIGSNLGQGFFDQVLREVSPASGAPLKRAPSEQPNCQSLAPPKPHKQQRPVHVRSGDCKRPRSLFCRMEVARLLPTTGSNPVSESALFPWMEQPESYLSDVSICKKQ